MPWTTSLILYSFSALFSMSVLFGSRAIGRWRRGLPVVPVSPSSPAPWGLLDLMVCLVTVAFFQSLFRAAILGNESLDANVPLEKIPPNVLVKLVSAGSLATLAATALSLVVVKLRVGATGRELGWDASYLKADLKLGVGAFLVLAGPVFLMQMILTQFFPSSHPLIEMIREHRKVEFFVANGIAAVFVAPLCEEILFRLLLLGWLRNLARRDLEPIARILGPGSASRRPSESVSLHEHDIPGRSAGDPAEKNETFGTASREPLWPVVLSAALFALAHLSHGPDPIPLFFLSLGLGYLYQKTGRILPCIIVHFLLNAWTMYLLVLYVYGS